MDKLQREVLLAALERADDPWLQGVAEIAVMQPHLFFEMFFPYIDEEQSEAKLMENPNA